MSGLNRFTSEPFFASQLTNYTARLSEDGDEYSVIRQIKDDVYKFRDPRMSSYIKPPNEMLDSGVGRHRG